MRVGLYILLSVLFCSFCKCQNDEEDLDSRGIFDNNIRFIDLSHPIDNNTVQFPGQIKFTYIRTIMEYTNGNWFAMREFCTSEHGGTHLDAPYHFDKRGWKAGQIPLKLLIAKLVVLDLRKLTADNSNFVLTKNHIENTLYKKLAKIKENVFLLFRFGWSKYYKNQFKYLGGTEVDNLHFPGIAIEVAELIRDKFSNIVGLGTDTASIDPGYSTEYEAHKILLPTGRYFVENISFEETDEIEFKTCTSMAIPPKYTEGTGSEVRIIAICKKYSVFE